MELVSSFKLELEKEVKIYFHKLFQNKGIYWRILYSISLYYVWQSIPYHKTLPGEALNQMPLIWFEWKLLWTQKNQREKFFASLHSVLIHCCGQCSLYMPPPPPVCSQIQTWPHWWNFRLVFRRLGQNLFWLTTMFISSSILSWLQITLR